MGMGRIRGTIHTSITRLFLFIFFLCLASSTLLLSISTASAAGIVVLYDNYTVGYSTTYTFYNDNADPVNISTTAVCYHSSPYSIGINDCRNFSNYYTERAITGLSYYDTARFSFYAAGQRTLGADVMVIQGYFDSSWHDCFTPFVPTNTLTPVYYGPYTINTSSTKLRIKMYFFNMGHTGYIDNLLIEADKRPALTWTGETGYTTAGVAPNSGATSEQYIYKIKYSDGDNDAPAANYPKVHILKNGAEIAGSPFAMSGASAGDTIYSDGKIYTYSATLAAGSDYTYYFEATDGWLAADNTATLSGPTVIQPDIKGYVKDPANIPLQGIKIDLTGTESRTTYTDATGYYEFTGLTCNGNYTITPSSFSYYSFTPSNRMYSNLQAVQLNQDYARANSAPAMQWTGEAGYETDGLNFILGSTNTVFAYRIKYVDAQNDMPAPDYPKVHIKKGGNEISGSPFVMNEANTNDILFTDGKIYVSSASLPIGLDYSYYFVAYDTFGAQGNTSEVSAPDVTNNPLPMLECCHDKYFVNVYGEQSPCFSLVYYDYYNSMPSAGYPMLTYWTKDNLTPVTETLNLKGAKGAGWLYEKSLNLPVGVYIYKYSVKNSQFADEYTLEQSSFVVARRPVKIENDGGAEATVVSTGKVTLKWNGISADGEKLKYRLYIGPDPASMKLVYEGDATTFELNTLDYARDYCWQVEAVNEFGISSKSRVYRFSTVTKITKAFNYPNPFNPSTDTTSIVFDMPAAGTAEISVFSELGDLCWQRSFANLPQGSNEVKYDGRDDGGRVLYNGSYNCVVEKKYNGKEEKNNCRLLVIK